MQTPHFDEAFNHTTFAWFYEYKLIIRVPSHISLLKNASILLDIDYDIEPEYEFIKLNLKKIELTGSPMKLTLSVDRQLRFLINFKRNFNQESFDSWKTKRTTGMRVTWKYNMDFKEKSIYKGYNRNFIKLTNLLVAVDSETLWKNVIAAKVKWFIKREDSSSYSKDLLNCILYLGLYFLIK